MLPKTCLGSSNNSDSDLKVEMIKQRSKMEKTIQMLVAAGKGESSQVFSIIELEDVDVQSADELKRTALHVSSPVPSAHDMLC